MPKANTSPAPSLNLYSGEPQHETFARMKELFPTGSMRPAIDPYSFPMGSPIELPDAYDFEGENRSTRNFLAATDTAALLVLRDGVIQWEQYALTGGPAVQWISWSVAKSFVSALVGIAIHEGHIENIEDPIVRYALKLAGSAYDGVRIEDVLQMSSGARWNEDYSDPDSDIHRFGAAIAGGGSLDAYVAGMKRAQPSGTLCQYNSADTQALGMLLVGANGALHHRLHAGEALRPSRHAGSRRLAARQRRNGDGVRWSRSHRTGLRQAR